MKTRFLLAITFSFLCWQACAVKKQDGREIAGFFLPALEAKKLIVTIHGNDAGIEGYWVPSLLDIQNLEADIAGFLNSHKTSGNNNLLEYERQYAGIIKEKRKVIFVRGFHPTIFGEAGEQKTKALLIAGGGEMVFSAEYDPEKRAFQWFGFNALR